MCKCGTDRQIYVHRRNNPFVEDGWHPIMVDACIADEVQCLNDEGVITTGCCCGHGKEGQNPHVLFEKESLEKMQELGYECSPYCEEDACYYAKLKKEPSLVKA